MTGSPAPVPAPVPALTVRRRLIGAYLLVGGLALAALLAAVALQPPPPGAAVGAIPWPKRLEAARVGLYRRAELTRNVRGDYLDERGQRVPRPSAWAVLAALGARGTTWQQAPHCVDAGVATGCNLPLIELPLGAALALPLAALAFGAALLAHAGSARRRSAAAAAGALLAAALVTGTLGLANQVAWTRAGVTSLRDARVGLYRVHLYGDESRLDRYRGIDRLRAIGRGGAYTVAQPDGCGARGALACNPVQFELPLTWPLVGSLLSGVALALVAGRARRL